MECIDGDPLLRSMAVEMKRKYDKYWGSIDHINLMIFVAVVLDQGINRSMSSFGLGNGMERTRGMQ